jgi:hypothetical protein
VATVGIVANPASGRDVRRLVAGASVFDNAEKGSMVFRLLVGLGAVGVERAVLMPAGGGIGGALERLLAGPPPGTPLPRVEVLDQRLRGDASDTVAAVEAMRAERAGAIAVLGGDGTCRVVAGSCGDLPLCTLSTGTNNAFPGMREATAAGLALGLVATGRLGQSVLRREQVLLVERAGRPLDSALVDVARTSDRWTGARAIWDPDRVAELVVAFTRPAGVGLSALAALVDEAPRGSGHALHLRLRPARGSPLVVRAPIAPGLVADVGVADCTRIEPGDAVELAAAGGTVALDGEREHEVAPGERLTVRLSGDGPVTIDVDAAMAEAAALGLLRTPAMAAR